jgi:hypothetical protein
MTKLLWDQVGQRFYETGVDRGVLYIPDESGDYTEGYAWNGLTQVSEKPTGADATPQYADNIKYLNLVAAEEFGGTIEAFTYPDAFAQCDGSVAPTPGVYIGQQTRKSFGLAYRTLKGNDIDGTDLGYKITLVYGALAAPSEKDRETVNDTPAAVAFSWDFTTTAVDVPDYKPSATVVVDSTVVDPTALASLETILYGSDGSDPRLPQPADVFALFSGSVTSVTPAAPTFVSGTHVITIPTVTGVVYKIDGAVVGPGALPPITENTIVTAEPTTGYIFPGDVDSDWGYAYVA